MRTLSLLLLLLSLPVAVAASDSLNGTWYFSPGHSDDVARELARYSKEVSGKRRPPAGGSGDRIREADAAVSRQLVARALQEEILFASRTLDIHTDADALTMTFDQVRDRTVYTDGRGSVVDSASQLVSIAGWEKDSLIVEVRNNYGTRVLEQWQFNPQTRRIVETAIISHPVLKKPIELELQYGRNPPPARSVGDRVSVCILFVICD